MLKTKRYKNLFFDLDNTLFDFDACAILSLKECYNKHGLDKWFDNFDDFNHRYQEINLKLWDDYKHNLVKKEDVKFGRFRQPLEAKGVFNETLVAEIAEDFLMFCMNQNILVDDALDVVKQLSESYNLFIISNGFIEVQNRKMELTGLAGFFKKVILSEQVKAQKPSKEIFQYAVKSVNARKKESVMIGDNIEADIKGAKDFGMDQVFFDYNQNVEHHGKATYTVTRLKELLEIF